MFQQLPEHVVPARDVLFGVSAAENERHLIVRVAFLRCLFADPRLVGLFEQCDQFTGLLQATCRYIPLADALAPLIGLQHRHQLLTKQPADLQQAIDSVPRTPENEALIHAATTARDAVLAAYSKPDESKYKALCERLTTFVRNELNLPYDWLILELATRYYQLFSASLFGVDTTAEKRIKAGIVRSFTISIQPYESEQQWRARWSSFEQEVRTARDDEQARSDRPTRRVRDDASHLERYAEWFYRAEVKSPPDSKKRLVREYHMSDRSKAPTENEDHGATIRSGIMEAKRLLALGSNATRKGGEITPA